MKISWSAAIMNGKFESKSNNYDEPNLNRLHSVLGAGASVARVSAATPGDVVDRSPAYRLRSCGLQIHPLSAN